MNTGLYIYFGHRDDEVYAVDTYFDMMCTPAWLNNDLAKAILADICQMTRVEGLCIFIEVDGEEIAIAPAQLSSGVKALLIMLNDDVDYVQATRCGDNCAKWIIEISKVKKLTIALSHFLDWEQDVEIHVLNNNSVITTYEDYIFTTVELLNQVYEKKYMDAGII